METSKNCKEKSTALDRISYNLIGDAVEDSRKKRIDHSSILTRWIQRAWLSERTAYADLHLNPVSGPCQKMLCHFQIMQPLGHPL